MVTATRTPTRNRHKSTSEAANSAAKRRDNFEFDAPQWEDFTHPQYVQQRFLLEAAIYPPSAVQSQDQESIQGEWTVTQLLIPREEEGENYADPNGTMDDEDWFQRSHSEHEPTSPYSPAGPLISPSPALPKNIVATASPTVRSNSRGYASSLGGRDKERSFPRGGNSSATDSLSRMVGAQQQHSSPRPVLKGKPMRVPRPGAAVGAIVAASTDKNSMNGARDSGRIGDPGMVSSGESSRGSFMSILHISGGIGDMKSPLGRRRGGRGVNTKLGGRGQGESANLSSSLDGSPMHSRDSFSMGLLPSGSPMLGSPLAKTIGRSNLQQQQSLRQAGSTRLPRTSASIEESLLATDGRANIVEQCDTEHEHDYGQENEEYNAVHDEHPDPDHDHVRGNDLSNLVHANGLSSTNWSSSIPATPPILTAHLLRLLDREDGFGEKGGTEYEPGSSKQSLTRQGQCQATGEEDEQKNKRAHGPLPALRAGIGLRAMRVPNTSHTLLAPAPAQARASPLQPPIVKRVKVGGRFCPAPPPGKMGSRAASPPPSSSSNAATTAAATATMQPTVPAAKKEKPVKLDDLKKLLAEHNQKLRPHPHNNITRRR